MHIVALSPVTQIKRILAECSEHGEQTLMQLSRESGMTPANVASILEHNSAHFYQRKEGGVIMWSLAY